MTYIKWKDEVESYLVKLPEAEKQKIFSYFSEMYADKRDAGKSEAQIIEEFGAPYDVAKRILADSKENAPAAENGANANPANVSGGNNYNYNYYNYNYGGTPTPPPAPEPPVSEPPVEKSEVPDPYSKGLPMPDTATAAKPKNDPGKTAAVVILTILFVALSIGLWVASVSVLADGFANIGAAIGSIVSGYATAAEGTAEMGYGIVTVGAGFLMLAGTIALMHFIKKKLKAFKEKK